VGGRERRGDRNSRKAGGGVFEIMAGQDRTIEIRLGDVNRYKSPRLRLAGPVVCSGVSRKAKAMMSCRSYAPASPGSSTIAQTGDWSVSGLHPPALPSSSPKPCAHQLCPRSSSLPAPPRATTRLPPHSTVHQSHPAPSAAAIGDTALSCAGIGGSGGGCWTCWWGVRSRWLHQAGTHINRTCIALVQSLCRRTRAVLKHQRSRPCRTHTHRLLQIGPFPKQRRWRRGSGVNS
jgi:hypothetical protein